MDLNLNTTQNIKSEGKVTKNSVAKEVKPVAEPSERKNPWDIMIEFEMPRPPQGESRMLGVTINRGPEGDYIASLPRGKRITAPLPVYQACRRLIKAEDKHRVVAEEMIGNFKIGEK